MCEIIVVHTLDFCFFCIRTMSREQHSHLLSNWKWTFLFPSLQSKCMRAWEKYIQSFSLPSYRHTYKRSFWNGFQGLTVTVTTSGTSWSANIMAQSSTRLNQITASFFQSSSVVTLTVVSNLYSHFLHFRTLNFASNA